ncbi:MAG: TetR/AcrR family transcriptional regulator [Leptospiraceae bacterium]|nr:TetR/AcrR family transcriptional regulator [Leptospiraceae bacterium]
MQTPKESTKLSILNSAKEEFLEVGFDKASMRKIAKKANVSTSNIYNYFTNKEGILEQLVKSIISSIESGLNHISSDDHVEKRLNFSYETLKNRFNVILFFVDENRDILDLLLFHSNGSVFSNFLEDFTERITQLNIRQINYYKEHKGMQSLVTHDFFIRNLVSFFLNIFVEMIKNKKSKEEILEMEDNFLKFMHYGSKAILLDVNES